MLNPSLLVSYLGQFVFPWWGKTPVYTWEDCCSSWVHGFQTVVTWFYCFGSVARQNMVGIIAQLREVRKPKGQRGARRSQAVSISRMPPETSFLPIGRNSLNSHLPPMVPRANDLTFSNISWVCAEKEGVITDIWVKVLCPGPAWLVAD